MGPVYPSNFNQICVVCCGFRFSLLWLRFLAPDRHEFLDSGRSKLPILSPSVPRHAACKSPGALQILPPWQIPEQIPSFSMNSFLHSSLISMLFRLTQSLIVPCHQLSFLQSSSSRQPSVNSESTSPLPVTSVCCVSVPSTLD